MQLVEVETQDDIQLHQKDSLELYCLKATGGKCGTHSPKTGGGTYLSLRGRAASQNLVLFKAVIYSGSAVFPRKLSIKFKDDDQVILRQSDG